MNASQFKRYILFPLVLVLYEVAIYFANDMYLPAIPQIAKDFHVTEPAIAWAMVFWFVGTLVSPFFLGAYSESVGRRKSLLFSAVLFTASCGVSAVSNSLIVFCLNRVIQGIAVASLWVAGYSCIHELYDTEKEAIQTLAWMTAIAIFAPAIGPLLGSWALNASDWRMIFKSLFLAALLLTLALCYLMPETLPIEKRRPFSLKGILPGYAAVLKNWGVIRNFLAMSLGFCLSILWIARGSTLTMTAFHHTSSEFALIQAGLFSVSIVTSWMARFFIARMRADTLIYRTFFGEALSILLGVIGLLCFRDSLWGFIVPMFVYCLTSGLIFSSFSRLGVDAGPELPMGDRMGMLTIFLNFFGLLASCLALWTYTEHPIARMNILLVVLLTARLGVRWRKPS